MRLRHSNEEVASCIVASGGGLLGIGKHDYYFDSKCPQGRLERLDRGENIASNRHGLRNKKYHDGPTQRVRPKRLMRCSCSVKGFLISPTCAHRVQGRKDCFYHEAGRKNSIVRLGQRQTLSFFSNITTTPLFTFATLTVLILLLLSLVEPSSSSINSYQSSITPFSNKNSGQFHISQLCYPRSPFPITRRVEGATLSSTATDTDTNCTVTFRTKSAQQHFVIRFEELKLGCDDHLVLFDGDLDYGQPSIKDFSCRDNMASVPIIKTTGTFLTIRFSTDGNSKIGDGFRMVVTAVFDITMSDCPPEYAFCRSQLCVARSLFCDGINHCLDNSDEIGCNGPDDAIELPYALGFFVFLVLVISVGAMTCIVLHCRRDNPYAQYQHQLQRAFGVPLQTSSSLMFATNQQHPQYQFFQPANISPYITPQHHALIATLPRGYNTLPLNLLRQQQQQSQTLLAKPNNMPPDINGEYLMMTGLATQPQIVTSAAALQPAVVPTQSTMLQTANMKPMPNSQSILSTTTGGRYIGITQNDRGTSGTSGLGLFNASSGAPNTSHS